MPRRRRCDDLLAEVDVVLPERAMRRLQVGARDRVRLLAGLGGDRREREVAQDLAGVPSR
jgi:hypothetical protein